MVVPVASVVAAVAIAVVVISIPIRDHYAAAEQRGQE
jgi:hypothetical protein